MKGSIGRVGRQTYSELPREASQVRMCHATTGALENEMCDDA
ncbi:MAG: hypothetical protein AAF364_04785 [Pseudomonadota bacterium]